MKKRIFFATLKNIPLLIKFLIWTTNIKGLSFKRKLSIFLSCIITIDDLSLKIKFQLCQITALVFEFDYFVDVKYNSKENKYDASLILINNMIDNYFNDELLKKILKKEFLDIRNSDQKANSATNLYDYLDSSTKSIGLDILSAFLKHSLNIDYNRVLLHLGSKIIRYLSDIATIDKDKKENNVNINDYLGYDDISKELIKLKQNLFDMRIETRIDRFILDLTDLSFTFYDKEKDFEL